MRTFCTVNGKKVARHVSSTHEGTTRRLASGASYQKNSEKHGPEISMRTRKVVGGLIDRKRRTRRHLNEERDEWFMQDTRGWEKKLEDVGDW